MGIVIKATIDLAPGTRTEVLREAARLIADARAEAGCRAYDWSADPDLADRVHVFEEWESPEALAAHFRAPSFMGILELLGRFGIVGSDARKYRFDAVEPVYGPDGTPSARFADEGAG
ncbi:MAG: antibiotic biosynthesis monooxygenase [Sphingomonadaceae bacterium]|uniref:putative quinol monooxygenase n=1 Tax=Thermaurantiacus sp. TaxID=2820283 RepID=UPI00298F13FC|nr:putative quinol monooxygenase [Thermaurantiacus sp.]MCS6986222.1 antibiotic biosynthesis monooxygenase [Sphingomonadaceae bacterium]MDW8415879.1 putative quinol monooxygenase [Thermaurantiacus sp.]